MVILACVIALGVAISLSPGKEQPNNGQRNQAYANVQTGVRISDSPPSNSASNQNSADQRETAEPRHLGGWVTKENAPDWAMLFVTGIGLGIAIWQILETKNAVLKTERADVLLEAIGINPRYDPMYLTEMSVVSCSIKNFGPTRASEVMISTFKLTIEGEPDHENSVLPIAVIAAGDHVTPSFSFLGRMFKKEAILQASKGNKKLRFELAYSYRDVFGQQHSAEFSGEYYGLTRGGFIVERQHG